MKTTVLTFGVLSGLVLAVFVAVTMPFIEQIGFDRSMAVTYTAMVIAFLFVYFGIRSYRDNVLGGQITFGKGFQAGTLITIISSIFYVVSWLVVYYNFIPDFGDKYAAYLVEDLRAGGASQAAIDELLQQTGEMKAMLKNPFIHAAVAFTEPFPVGLLITLVSAAVLKRNKAS